ncbi:MAG: RagB/SusD family nutrient uptake outer membrane protein [Bacteroidales bacterium]|nr:RagB/SusD family nutrient uptake outer membrane protein [Bacteroidales bacterium]
MKNIIKGIIIAGALLSAASCQDFLNRPTEDNYNTSSFYQTDEQVLQGVNYLYNSPWYDFQRGFIKVGEVMSGNMYMGGSPYLSLTANGTDEDLMKMAYSLWAVNAHSNTVIKNLLEVQGSKASQEVINQAIGEALTLKALAYFFLVRSFGEVPIIHDNSDVLASGNYNEVAKVEKSCVYDYIILTLEKAMELLPKNAYIGAYNRIDYYAAEALLAKTYLTKAGVSGSLNSEDLAQAAKYAKDVIDNSGRSLSPTYSDIFRLSPKQFNATGEPLISWQWTVSGSQWTRQNSLQCDLMIEGFSENADLWGGWGGPSVDLADAFNVSVLDDPSKRVDVKGNSKELDKRRKCSMMMPGDHYEYFWTDRVDPIYGRTGFNWIAGLFAVTPAEGQSKAYAEGGPKQMECPTGTNCVKHLYGDNADHIAGVGVPADRMAYQLPTHILRMGDIYLVYAEAVVDSDNAAAAAAVNMIRKRAYGVLDGSGISEETFNSSYAVSSITREEIWKERRLELSGEGDYWYDFVRRAYFQPEVVIAEIKAQRRSVYNGLGDVYKNYYESGMTTFEYNPADVYYGNASKNYVGDNDNPNVTIDSFTLPFPTEDVVFNSNMETSAPAENVNVRELYKYNF